MVNEQLKKLYGYFEKDGARNVNFNKLALDAQGAGIKNFTGSADQLKQLYDFKIKDVTRDPTNASWWAGAEGQGLTVGNYGDIGDYSAGDNPFTNGSFADAKFDAQGRLVTSKGEILNTDVGAGGYGQVIGSINEKKPANNSITTTNNGGTKPASGLTAAMRATMTPEQIQAHYDQIEQQIVSPSSKTKAAPVKPNPAGSSFALLSGNLAQGSGSRAAPNQNVSQLQQLLNSAGGKLTVDGVFGPQTKSAVMAFQQKNGLTVDGIVGPQTAAALAKLSSGGGIMQGGGSYTPPNNTGGTAAKNTGNTTTGTANPQAERDQLNAQFNAEQLKDLELFKKSLGESVDVSDSEKIVKSILSSFENKNQEKVPSLAEQFNAKRKELGVDVKEAELNGIDAELAKLDSEFSALSDEETNRGVSVLKINQRKTAQQELYTKAKNDLITKRNSVANELNQKYGVIDSIMKYTSADYENAQQAYQVKFNQAIAISNLIKGVEDDKKSDREREVDNARANLQVIMDSIKGTDYNSLDSKTLLDIRKLELTAGLPAGFMQFASESVNEPIVSIGSEFTNGSNQRQVPVYTKDPVTGLVTAKVITIGTDKVASNRTTTTAKEEADDIAAAILDFQTQIKEKGWRGISPDAYAYYRDEIRNQYGAAAVLKLDKAIKSAGLQIDDANFKDPSNKREV